MTREELTKEAIQEITKTKAIAITAGTGSGKTKISLEVTNFLHNKDNSKKFNTLILVAERSHINNWEVEINKWNLNIGNYKIVCYASMHKVIDDTYDIVIFDEAHHLASERRKELLSYIKTSYQIFLSATLKYTFISDLSVIIGSKINVLKLSIDEAIKANILPEPKIFLIPLILDNTTFSETIVEEWGKSSLRVKYECNYADRFKFFKRKKSIPNCALTIHCTQKQKYDFLTEKFEYFKGLYMRTRNQVFKNKWLQYGSKRKKYLGEIKTSIVKPLLEKVKSKRFICFCSSIDQANQLGKANVIHSEIKNPQEVLNKFNRKEISNLFAVGMLQEGVNLTDIQVGIIIQLDGEERAFIQKFGRVLRSDSPVQYIFYVKNTRDEDYLKNALENIDKNYIKSITI